MNIKLQALIRKDSKKIICVGVPQWDLREKYPPADRLADILIDADHLVHSDTYMNFSEATRDIYRWAMDDWQCFIRADKKDIELGLLQLEIESHGELIDETSLKMFLAGFLDLENIFFIDIEANPDRKGCYHPASETPRTKKLLVHLAFNDGSAQLKKETAC